MQLDARTLAVASNAVDLLITAIGALIWTSGRMYPGFGRWTTARLCAGAALLLSIQVGVWPASVTVLGASILGLLNLVLTVEACREFLGLKLRSVWNFGVASLIFGWLVYLFANGQSAHYGYFTLVLTAAIGYSLCGWTLLNYSSGVRGSGLWITAIGFLFIGAIYAMRDWYYLNQPGGAITDSNSWNTAFLMIVTMLTIGLNAGFFLMHYERLLADTAQANSELTLLKQTLEATVVERTLELRESEGKFRSYVEGAPVALLVVDSNGGVAETNLTAASLTGYRSAELTGLNIADFVANESGVPVVGFPEWIARSSVGVRCELRQKNGAIRYVWFNAVRLPTGNWLIYIADQTERVQLEYQLAQAQKMESIGRLAGGVAHDFNNMLTVILGYAALGRDSVAPGSEHAEYLEQITRAATRSKDLTEQLLGFSRRQIIAPVPANMNEVVAELMPPLRRLIPENVDLRFLPAAVLPDVVVDRSQVNQILLNLVVNARDAMPKGGKLTVSTAFENVALDAVRLSPDLVPGRYVVISVTDTGTGIDKRTMPHIFEPFFTTKTMENGTGLGLATVYGIVRQNQGFVTVSSEPGRGTAFKIYFPCPATEVSPVRPVPEAPAPRNHAGTATILLVEDDELVRGMTQSMLTALGYTPLVARSPTEALGIVSRNPAPAIGMILTDVVMPGMDGIELRDRVRILDPDIKVLFMSGYNSSMIEDRGCVMDGVHFIQKPFGLNDLSQRIAETLAS
jgi:PAS domain S-box-containing protein